MTGRLNFRERLVRLEVVNPLFDLRFISRLSRYERRSRREDVVLSPKYIPITMVGPVGFGLVMLVGSLV